MIFLHVIGSIHFAHWAVRSLTRKVLFASGVVMLMLVVSLVEAWLWSLTYRAVGAIEGAEKALYFSMVTFTTLGYGDVVLDESWRLLAAIQAALGIVIFGWSTAMVIGTIQRLLAIDEERQTRSS